MTQLQLTKDLYILEVPVPRPESQATSQAVANNHIWIIDRSGSMGQFISDLVEDVIGKLPTLADGDTLSVGWFSGEGQYDFIIKGHQIAGAKSHAAIATILRKYASTVGMTCFSEILQRVPQLIADLEPFGNSYSLVFFTDGNPVVNNFAAEITKITAAIAAISPKLASALLVGYGPYYNRELLGSMASQFSGTFIHASNLADYSNSLTEYLEDAKLNCGKVTINGAFMSELGVFSLSGNTVVNYRSAPEIQFAVPRKGKSAYYAILTAPIPGVAVEKIAVGTPGEASWLRAAYAAALVLNQKAKSDKSIDVLGALGDVALVNQLNNSFTNDEHGAVETALRAAIKSPKNRFTKGRAWNLVPDAGAFCVFDAINTLTSDPDCRFLPYHPGFTYRRIGPKVIPDTSKVKFTPDDTTCTPVDTLTWNDSRLNLSITFRVSGTVPLDEQASAHGFISPYPTFIWRSFTLVKDGVINMETAFFTMSEDTFKVLKGGGALEPGALWAKDMPIAVQFKNLPVMNRGIANGRTTAKNFATSAIREIELEQKQKLVNDLLETFEGKASVPRTALTEAQTAYLAKFHIGHNGFAAPAAESPASTDSYEALEFTIKVAGLSTRVSLAKLQEKLKKVTDFQLAESSGKKPSGRRPTLTEGEELAQKVYKQLLDAGTNKSAARLAVAKDETKAELRALRRELQRNKMAIMLAKRWFDEFSSRDENTITVDGREVTFNLRRIQVPI